MKKWGLIITILIAVLAIGAALAAEIIPNEVEMPGTQPGEAGNLESPDKCDGCHGGYDTAVEPAFNWRGSMMANAGRDPIFWATLAIAEQDFDGVGDMCIRCHSTSGWLGGNSTPTDGSGLAASDADGVDCDTCHKMTNPDNRELLGVMNAPFIANDGGAPATGYYGSGMLSIWSSSEKLGPYTETVARHQFLHSDFHRSKDFCGSCHDVSNPVVGDLAANNGAQPTGDPVVASGVLGAPLTEKAAFNNYPYMYGVVERTYSEYYAGLLSQTRVRDYASLPADLQAGAVQAAFQSAGGDYADGTPRYFTCQTCHMQAVTGEGCNKNDAPTRSDLPLHDMTGGNYWVSDAIQYQDNLDLLRLGGGLTSIQVAALDAGKARAMNQLNLAASLQVTDNTLTVTNLTGHKLISGYPEGRRMWLNIKWYDTTGTLLREDGEYGEITVEIDGSPTTVRTLLDLQDPNAKVYEAHYGMTQDWAADLIDLGYDPNLVLSYDRQTGTVGLTLGQLASQPEGTDAETFHFALNNTVIKDNRIPPYGFSYDEARKRNALPVPADQYGGSGAGSTYDYWDEFNLNPPASATYAEISLMYQPTSWEYIQFLYLANDQQNAFLGEEGINILDTWLNTGMAEPHVMAATEWGTPPSPGDYTLTVNVTGSGSVTRNPNKSTYTYGEVVELTAVPTSGWSFAGWSGDLTGSTNPASISMTGDKTVTATFTQNEYTLTVNVVGSGSVTRNPNKSTYTSGEVVELTATANPGWSFADWSGDLSGSTNPASISMTGDKTVTANFTESGICSSPGTPVLQTPDNGSATNNPSPLLAWSAANNATRYQIQYSTDPAFTIYTQTDTTSTSFNPAPLVDGDYHWRVRGHNNASGCDLYGAWSTAWLVQIDTVDPSGTMVSPAAGGTLGDPRALLLVTADDNHSGVKAVTFSAHYDGSWHELGSDQDGSDGWRYQWATWNIPKETIRVSANIQDHAGNTFSLEVGNLSVSSSAILENGYEYRGSSGLQQEFLNAEVKTFSEIFQPYGFASMKNFKRITLE